MVLNYVLVGCSSPVCPCKCMANNPWVFTYWICLPSLVSTSAIFDWHNWKSPTKSYELIIKDRPYGERLQKLNLLSLASRRLFMDLVFLFKCMMGLYDLDLSYYLVHVSADNSTYNLRHASYQQFKTRSNDLNFLISLE